MNSKKQKEHCTRLLREHELGRGEWQGGSQGKLLTTLPYALTYCTYHKKDNNIISLMSGSGCSTALLVGLWTAQAVGCGLWMYPWMWMRQLQELYFYIFLCTALFWHRSGRAAPTYVCVCAPVFTIYICMYIHAYLDPATWTAGCALSLALLSFV